MLLVIGAAKEIGKVHGEPQLSTDARAGFVFARDKSKRDGESAADVVLTA